MLSMPDLVMTNLGNTLSEVYANTIDYHAITHWSIRCFEANGDFTETIIAQLGENFNMNGLINSGINGITVAPAKFFGNN